MPVAVDCASAARRRVSGRVVERADGSKVRNMASMKPTVADAVGDERLLAGVARSAAS
jgi:hypothetical protein